VLVAFEIQRSLSRKGNPYDNAVAEATFKAFKIEFVYQNKFKTLKELEVQLKDYINWFNKCRIHGSLGYVSPVEYRLQHSL
jgi:transposase InsO family protein